VVPVKTTTLYKFYREYCGVAGYPRYAAEPKFLAEIGKRTDARREVRRYLNGAGTRQATFVYPPPGAHAEVEPPANLSEPLWLGDCLTRFDAGVQAWREGG
jgi:hypothetical protein